MIVIWSLAELGSAITLSSVPSIRPLYAHLFLKNKTQDNSQGSSDAIKRPKKSGAGGVPFSITTIGSIADRSRWGGRVQMFSASQRSEVDREGTRRDEKPTESQYHIVLAEKGDATTPTQSPGMSEEDSWRGGEGVKQDA